MKAVGITSPNVLVIINNYVNNFDSLIRFFHVTKFFNFFKKMKTGLKRTGKSCRLRWLNYLKPDIRRGNLTPQEQLLILELHSKWGNRWVSHSHISRVIYVFFGFCLKGYMFSKVVQDCTVLTGKNGQRDQELLENKSSKTSSSTQHRIKQRQVLWRCS